MKRHIYLPIIIGLILMTNATSAQNYVALHQAAGVSHFQGALGFKNAYDNANSGDTIYLPGGHLFTPDTIKKTIFVFGVGHYPSVTGATGKTFLTTPVILDTGADNSYFEGIHFMNSITFRNNAPVSDVMFRRCRFEGQISINGNKANPSHNIKIIQCVYNNTSNIICGNTIGMEVSNSLLRSGFFDLSYGVVSNNLFFNPSGHLLASSNCHNNFVRNNISRSGFYSGIIGNHVQNNVFATSFTPPPNNFFDNNHFGVNLVNFFINYDLTAIFSYDYDFNLENPDDYLGTDETQVGIFGGLFPYKPNAIPLIPRIVSRQISTSIDANGKIQVNIEVSAQDD